MSERKRTIFLFSMEPWGDMWYSKHHYAAQLAREHTVYFVSLPDRWRWTDLFSFGVRVRQVPEGVQVLEYRNNLPLRLLSGWLQRWILRANARKLARLMPDGEVLLWSFHPTELLHQPPLRRKGTKIIYHVVDPYQTLPYDRQFASQADLVVAINPWYLDHYGRINRHCILVPHGVRPADREHDDGQVEALRKLHGDYAVLATGINQFVNYPLLIALASRHPDLRLVVAGQMFPMEPELTALRERLFALPNVRYAGVLHPDRLKDLIRGAKVGLLTYDFEPTRSVPASAGRTPLKVLTYLAQACPMVSTNNSYVPALEDRGHFKAEDEEHFLALVGEVLEGRRSVDKLAVNAYLDSVTYERLSRRVLDALDAAGAEQVPEPPADDPRDTVPAACPVMIVSNEAWDGPRYSKHRYATALSSRRKVYFIDPPSAWKPAHLFSPGIRSYDTPEGITVLSYHNAIPLFGGLLRGINDRVVSGRLRRYIKAHHAARPVFWTFDPSRLADPSLLDPELSIYHCADDYALRWKSERLLARRVDHVFCIARELMPRFEPFNRSVHHVPHGLAEADMQPGMPDAGSLPLPPGYGLYIGNINDRHDFPLWEKLFRASPGVDWLIVGPVKVTDALGKCIVHERPFSNVHFMGPVPYAQLRDLIAGAAFGFLYMRPDQPANRISSQKVVQFLAQGRPFFCSWFSEYADHRDLVYMTESHEAALAVFRQWREQGEPPERAQQRLAFSASLRFKNLIANLPFRL